MAANMGYREDIRHGASYSDIHRPEAEYYCEYQSYYQPMKGVKMKDIANHIIGNEFKFRNITKNLSLF